MHHVIVNIGEARIVARFAESGMIRHDHAEPAGPGRCEIKTIHGACAMKEDERLARACRLDNCFDTIHERSEEHTSELQSRFDLVCRLLLEKKKKKKI